MLLETAQTAAAPVFYSKQHRPRAPCVVASSTVHARQCSPNICSDARAAPKSLLSPELRMLQMLGPAAPKSLLSPELRMLQMLGPRRNHCSHLSSGCSGRAEISALQSSGCSEISSLQSSGCSPNQCSPELRMLRKSVLSRAPDAPKSVLSRAPDARRISALQSSGCSEISSLQSSGCSPNQCSPELRMLQTLGPRRISALQLRCSGRTEISALRMLQMLEMLGCSGRVLRMLGTLRRVLCSFGR